MSMYFYDDTDDWSEYKIVKDEIHRLETERLELRREIEDAKSAFKSDPANENLQFKVDWLKMELKEIEKKLNESLNMYR